MGRISPQGTRSYHKRYIGHVIRTATKASLQVQPVLNRSYGFQPSDSLVDSSQWPRCHLPTYVTLPRLLPPSNTSKIQIYVTLVRSKTLFLHRWKRLFQRHRPCIIRIRCSSIRSLLYMDKLSRSQPRIRPIITHAILINAIHQPTKHVRRSRQGARTLKRQRDVPLWKSKTEVMLKSLYGTVDLIGVPVE